MNLAIVKCGTPATFDGLRRVARSEEIASPQKMAIALFPQRQIVSLGASMSRLFVLAAIVVGITSVMPAQAKCLNKAAVATAGSEKDAKWYVLETMVQTVSWGLWPSFLADGSTPGWRITKQGYRCKASGVGVTCRGQATFCETGSN